MLVLTRKYSQRIKIGDDIFLTVFKIKPSGVEISVKSPLITFNKARFCKEDEIDFNESIKVKVVDIIENSCKIGIVAPREINIVRMELLDNGKKNS